MGAGMTPWGEIGLLGACMMVLTVLMRTAGPVPLRDRLRRGFPLSLGLFFAGLGAGRLLAVPGFAAAHGWPELTMTSFGLTVWAVGLFALLRKP